MWPDVTISLGPFAYSFVGHISHSVYLVWDVRGNAT